jgi:hypothetical protein
MPCFAAPVVEPMAIAPVGVALDLALDGESAAQHVEELALAVALEPGDADELAGADLDVDRLAVRAQAHAARAEHRLAATLVGRACALAGAAGEPAGAGYQLDDLVGRPLAALERGDRLAGAHDGDAVSHLEDLVHAMGDEDDADALAAEPPDHLEQAIAGGDVERRGRLVEHQDPRPVKQRPHDAAGLPVAERELLGRAVEIEPAIEELIEELLGAGALLAGADPRAQQPFVAEPDVVDDRAGLGDQHLLEHRRDAVLAGRARRRQRAGRSALDLDLADVGRVDAGEDPHERALARAVLTDDRVDLAGQQLEGGVAQGLRLAERLPHAGDSNERRAGTVGVGDCRFRVRHVR